MTWVGPKTPFISSLDKRFEVDGANTARMFITSPNEADQR
jgi:hypothetical protein